MYWENKQEKMRRIRRSIWERQRRMCVYCGVRLLFKETTIDHMIPLSMGGPNRCKNFVVACVECNQAKANLSVPLHIIHELQRRRKRGMSND